MRNKLRNDRYREKQDHDDQQPSAKRKAPMKDLPGYLPTLSKPAEAVVRDLQRLQRNGAVPPEEAEQLKESTFAERRRLTVSAKLPVWRLQQKAPWLFSKQEVSKKPIL